MGPLVGGFAAQAKGWRWTIWELVSSGHGQVPQLFTLHADQYFRHGFLRFALCSVSRIATFVMKSLLTLLVFFLLPETSSANILYRRTMRMRKLTGNDKLTCEAILAGENMTGKDIIMMTLVKPITLNFLEPMVALLNLYIALIYGMSADQLWRGFVNNKNPRAAVHLVRIVPTCICRNLWLQSRSGGPCIHRSKPQHHLLFSSRLTNWIRFCLAPSSRYHPTLLGVAITWSHVSTRMERSNQNYDYSRHSLVLLPFPYVYSGLAGLLATYIGL